MRHPYIALLFLCIALPLSSCASDVDLKSWKNPHSLTSRVGNYSPARLDNDKKERIASREVTPLPRGSRDLDGREENYDPAFGAADGMAASPAQAQAAPSQKGAAPDATDPQARFGQPRVSDRDNSSRNGYLQINGNPQQQQSSTTSGGFGCPPSGMTSVQTAPLQAAPQTQLSPGIFSMSKLTQDSDVVNAQTQRLEKVQIKCTAVVKRLLPDDRDGKPHQRFLLGLSNGTTVLVAHNIDLAPYVPIREGDFVTVSGEYIWNEKGGVIHYTHHSTNPHHAGGFIEYNRQTYQ